MKRFAAGLVLMFAIAMVPIWFIRNMAGLAYGLSVLLLLAVEFFGEVGMGAQRWIDIGPLRLQPSELMKITLVMMLAAYYDWLDTKKTSRPLWVLIPVVLIVAPTALVLIQPNLGTALMLLLGGAVVMFAAGVSLWYFGLVGALGVGAVAAVFTTRGTPWQLLHDYQYRRIDTFLDPTTDPLGAGYNIIQAQIALGSGGWSGKGFMQGTQSRLNFLPEKHTDFIFTTLAEEFGFIGAFSLLLLYGLIIVLPKGESGQSSKVDQGNDKSFLCTDKLRLLYPFALTFLHVSVSLGINAAYVFGLQEVNTGQRVLLQLGYAGGDRRKDLMSHNEPP
jgi:rod shape determining protein RodA